MNVLKRELKAGLKPFVFWSIGLFVLVFVGTVKFTGVESGGEAITALFSSFPRIVLAVLGCVDINPTTFGGYYALLTFYALLVSAVYAVYLGANAVTREAVDKTYEFVFTKPRSRSYILAYKLLSGFIFITVYSIFQFIFSYCAVLVLDIQQQITDKMILFCVSLFICSLVFFALSVMLTCIFDNAEQGTKAANWAIIFTYILGVGYDLFENVGFIRFLSPFKYFLPNEILNGEISVSHIIFSAVLIIVCLSTSFYLFSKKDLKAA